MSVYSFLIIASLTTVKPVRLSLFLANFGAEHLPYAFIVVAAVSFVFVSLYSRLTRVVRLNRIIAASTFAACVSLMIIWLLLTWGYAAEWFIYAFFAWVAIHGLLSTTQFWLLASYVFDTREAKRLFGVIGAGAIAGGVFGGYLTSFFAPIVGTAGMLPFSLAMLLGCLFIQNEVWRGAARATYHERLRRQERDQDIAYHSAPWLQLFQDSLVTRIAGIVGVGVLVGTLIDYQFSAFASDHIGDQDQLTAFFGFWLSNVSIISLFLQLFGTGRILKKFGVIGSLTVLPVVVCVGAGALIAAPTLAASTILKAGEGGLKQSLNKAGMELLGLPIPVRLRNSVKAMIDVAVDNLATGVAGALILLLAIQFDAGPKFLGVVILCLSVFWILMVWRSRAEYLDAFRKAIEKRSIQYQDLSYDIYSSIRSDYLLHLLESGNERHIILALDFLQNMRDERLAGHLERLAESSSPEILTRVLRAARYHPKCDLRDRARVLISISERKVCVAAMSYLLHRADDKAEITDEFTSNPNEKIRAAIIEAAALEWSESRGFRDSVDIRKLLDKICTQVEDACNSERIGVAIARAIEVTQHFEQREIIDRLLQSDNDRIRSQGALAVARSRDIVYVPQLINMLRDKNTRLSAREALTEYGEEIVPLLVSHLHDSRIRFRTRFEIPRVISMIGTHECFATLAAQLEISDSLLRHQVIKSMNKMRTRDPKYRLRSRTLDPVILAEIRRYYEVSIVHESVAKALRKSDNAHQLGAAEARKFVCKALRERQIVSLERIFRLLGLKHPPVDMYNAFLRITSGNPDVRANAVELIDLVLTSTLKASLLPIIEHSSEERLTEIGARLFGIHFDSEFDGLQMLLRDDSDWLQICAIYACSKLDYPLVTEQLESLSESSNPYVREAVSLHNRNLSPILQSN